MHKKSEPIKKTDSLANKKAPQAGLEPATP